MVIVLYLIGELFLLGQCRLSCVRQLATAPRDTDCQRHPFCSSCWELCREFGAQKHFRLAFCAPEEPSCDRGCRLACDFFDDDDVDKRQPRNRQIKEFSTELPEVELSTSFVGCTLYWKASGNQESVYLHQLYGLDEQDTWFDIGQTVESFHTFQPEEAGKAVKIRLVAIASDKGTVAETELAFEGQKCDEDQPRATKEYLFQNVTADATSEAALMPAPNTALIVTSSILLTAFVIAVVVVAVRHRKRITALIKRRENFNTVVQHHPDMNQEPNNQRFSHYLRAVREETSRHDPIVGSSPGSHSLYV